LDRFKRLWGFTWFRVVAAIVIIAVLGAFYYFISVPVQIGNKVVCRYGHLIRDDTTTIRLPSFLADGFRAKIEKTVCSRHQKCEQLYANAQKKIAGKKYKDAKTSLTEVKELDPKFKQTNTQLKAIDKFNLAAKSTGSSSNSNSSGNSSLPSSSGTVSPETKEPVQIDLSGLLPQGDIPGYIRGTLLTNSNSAQIDFHPTSTTQAKTRSLLFTVRKMNNNERAKSFISNTSERVFPNNQKSPSIEGNTAYFGTNIYGYANLSWPQDILVYEVQMLSTKATPLDLYDHIVKVTDYCP